METDYEVKFLNKLRQERDRQVGKWGAQNHSGDRWMTILGEEYGEVCRGVFEYNEQTALRELVEVAAVAMAAYDSICRNGLDGGRDE